MMFGQVMCLLLEDNIEGFPEITLFPVAHWTYTEYSCSLKVDFV